MLVIACIDERKGMMFNRRRQSRDSAVSEDILRDCSGKTLYLSAYSRKLFQEKSDVELIVSEDIKNQAPEDGICFVEDTDIFSRADQIDKVILYQWNRHYPADVYFPLQLSREEWEMTHQEQFQGVSHEKITKEIYCRRKKHEYS